MAVILARKVNDVSPMQKGVIYRDYSLDVSSLTVKLVYWVMDKAGEMRIERYDGDPLQEPEDVFNKFNEKAFIALQEHLPEDE